MGNKLEFLIGGDFYVSEKFAGDIHITKEIIDLFEHTDFRIINLESPICQNHSNWKIVKTGPHLRTSAEAVLPLMKKMSIDLVTMANNHILDYGENGLLQTLSTLDEHGIHYAGAGKNSTDAAKVYSIEKNGISIAILNFAENEWSIAGNDHAGANPLDIISNVRQIKNTKLLYDKVICIIHGGQEFYSLPSPRIVKQYRFYAENGADAIICHHTHCISGIEYYQNVPIAYGLGNMIFTKEVNDEKWYTGLLAKLVVQKDKHIELKLIPVLQDRDSFELSKPGEIVTNDILREVDELSAVIADETSLENEWDLFVQSKKRVTEIFSPLQNIPGKY